MPPVPLAASLLVIWFRANSVSLGRRPSWTFALSLGVFALPDHPTTPPPEGMLRNRWRATIRVSANHEHATATVWFPEWCLPLLTEFMCSFAYGLVAVASEICKNTLQRLGGQSDKHGHSLRGPCDRCLAIFIFRELLDNSAFAASDVAARDLISS
jgi:hypothetical protein